MRQLLTASMAADMDEHRMVRGMAASRAQHAQQQQQDAGTQQAAAAEDDAILALAMEVKVQQMWLSMLSDCR